MGTRTTCTVGAATATYAIKAALETGRLSNDALERMLEVVSDELRCDGGYNFTVLEGQGEDDDEWVRWRQSMQEHGA
jgi:hypothetical protein